jgi:NADPH2:quinone reductase
VYPLPDGIDSAAALCLGISYCTAYGGLVWRAHLEAGETLLVLAAAGGVGLAAVEVGRAIGAFVIAAAGGKEKCRLAFEHGANAVIDYRDEDLRGRIRDLTPHPGLDVVFDPVGGELSETALRSLRPDGRLVSIGFASGSMPQIQPNILLVKNTSLLGFNFGAYIGWSSVDEREYYEPKVRCAVEHLFEWYEQGRIRPFVAASYPLERFAEAQDALLGRSTVGKIMLVPSES